MTIEELLPAVSDNVNLVVIVVLLAVGYIVKHTPVFDKVANKYIPIILVIFGVAVTFMITDSDIGFKIVGGILNTAIAIGFHSSGKSIFEIFSKSVKDTIVEEDDMDI